MPEKVNVAGAELLIVGTPEFFKSREKAPPPKAGSPPEKKWNRRGGSRREKKKVRCKWGVFRCLPQEVVRSHC